MANITVEYVLEAEGAWEFKPEVKQLATFLQDIQFQTAVAASDVASQLFKVARVANLTAGTIKEGVAPLADITDAVELAMDTIMKIIAGRPEAYITPPPGDAVEATITESTPVEQ
jgi:hypothetical protein